MVKRSQRLQHQRHRNRLTVVCRKVGGVNQLQRFQAFASIDNSQDVNLLAIGCLMGLLASALPALGEVSSLRLFKDLANPMPVARYHSLMGQDLPKEFIVNAEYNGIIMAIRHRDLPICAFQFHPESILTVQGSQLLQQSIEWLLNR